MFERFARDTRRAVERAVTHEAPALGSGTVEAEHLLLALAGDVDGPAGGLLAGAGLDHDRVREALDRERERSLAAVGVRASDFELPTGRTAPVSRRGVATSARVALERGLRHAGGRRSRRYTSLDLLVGILSAEHGTVPRALVEAGVDQTGLREAAQALAAGGEPA